MSIVKSGFEVRLYPNQTQAEIMSQNIGNNRLYYNQLLQLRMDMYEHGEKYTHADAQTLKKFLEAEFEWFSITSASSLQQTRRDLDTSYNNFFDSVSGKRKGKKVGFPKFKSKHVSKWSYREPYNGGNADVLDKHIKLPKIGNVKFKGGFPKYTKIYSITITQRRNGKWFASVVMDRWVDEFDKTGAIVGIDLGLEFFLTTSDGDKYNLRQILAPEWKKLKELQSQFDKGKNRLIREGKNLHESKNHLKRLLAIQNQNERIANIRSDYLEKLSTAIVKQYDIICVEDLNISGMMKNKHLSKAIQDSGWSMFLNKLEYKCRWRGKTFVKIGRYEPTSTMCSNCHAMHKDIVNSLSVRFWTCPDCGAEHDRDINAAKNILIIGIGQILGMVEDHAEYASTLVKHSVNWSLGKPDREV